MQLHGDPCHSELSEESFRSFVTAFLRMTHERGALRSSRSADARVDTSSPPSAELPLKGKPPLARREARNIRKKLVATVFRREGVYNRAEKPSVTFCGEEERRSGRAMTFYKKSRRELSEVRDDDGADDQIRTDYLVITNDVLYLLSYISAATRIITNTRSECKHFFQIPEK